MRRCAHLLDLLELLGLLDLLCFAVLCVLRRGCRAGGASSMPWPSGGGSFLRAAPAGSRPGHSRLATPSGGIKNMPSSLPSIWPIICSPRGKGGKGRKGRKGRSRMGRVGRVGRVGGQRGPPDARDRGDQKTPATQVQASSQSENDAFIYSRTARPLWHWCATNGRFRTASHHFQGAKFLSRTCMSSAFEPKTKTYAAQGSAITIDPTREASGPEGAFPPPSFGLISCKRRGLRRQSSYHHQTSAS